jgi:hypothetical protein
MRSRQTGQVGSSTKAGVGGGRGRTSRACDVGEVASRDES